MQIDITAIKDMDCWNLAHSRAEGGENAGAETWQAAMREAEETKLLNTSELLDEFRDYVRELGAWEAEETDAWNPTECNALFLQFLAWDVREAGADSLAEIDWRRYRKSENNGRIYKSGRKFYAYL